MQPPYKNTDIIKNKVMEITIINKENAKDYIGKKVEVEICCSSFGMMYPDDNYLESFDGETWIFKSDDAENGTWEWKQKDVECEITVYDFDEYQKAYAEEI